MEMGFYWPKYREILKKKELYRYSVSLPKKHNKGGSSSGRFARIRLEARQHYLTKVSELATKYFIDPEKSQPNVCGIVLGGSAEFKDQLNDAKILDPRLLSKIIAVVDVAYGFKQGLQQAVELCADTLRGVTLIHQKRLLSKFFEEISQDTGKYCFGTGDTMHSLEAGAVETLLIWERCNLVRYCIRDGQTGKEEIVLKVGDEPPFQKDEVHKEVIDWMPLLDWFVDHYKEFGTQLEIVQDCTAEGSQFCNGFGGFGGLLRYKMDFHSEDLGENDKEVNDTSIDSDDGDDIAEYF